MFNTKTRFAVYSIWPPSCSLPEPELTASAALGPATPHASCLVNLFPESHRIRQVVKAAAAAAAASSRSRSFWGIGAWDPNLTLAPGPN